MSNDEVGAAIAGGYKPSDATFWPTADPGNPLTGRTRESGGECINVAGGGDLTQTPIRQAGYDSYRCRSRSASALPVGATSHWP